MSETRAEYNAGEPPPELTDVIIERITFPDGSELLVVVRAPGPAISMAHELYYNQFMWPLRHLRPKDNEQND